MWLLTLLSSLLGLSSCYYQRSDSNTCSSLIYRCSYNFATCSKLYSKYYTSCREDLESTKGHCSRRCRRSLGALVNHPQFALESFKECDCQGDNTCKRQKCKLLGCLDEPCTEVFSTTPPPEMGGSFSTLSSTPSGHSITMITSTVALDKVNCETVIVHCEKKKDCKVLLQGRDRVCTDYTLENPVCSTKCRSANQLLKENFIGKHLTTCKFEIPKLESTRFSNLMTSCVPRNQHTQSPTYNTQIPSRPVGDCKRHYEECKSDYTCNAGFNDVMKYCKTKTNGLFVSVCSSTCADLVTNFTSNPAGQALWGCSCGGSYVSRRCETIKHTFNDICSSAPCRDVLSSKECLECSRGNSCKRDCGLMCRKTCNRCAIDGIAQATTDSSVALTTFDASVQTTLQTKSAGLSISAEPSSPVSTFYVVNVSCEDGMNIRIDYSPEINYSPHFAPEDKSCEVEASSPGSHSATMKLQYDPPNCGTQVKHGTHGYRLARNKIYVRSVSNPSFQEIREIECKVPAATAQASDEDNMTEVREDTGAELRIYRDPEYKLGFDKLAGNSVYLGDHKTVYGEILTNNSQTFILQSCYATPNSNPLNHERHFFIHNGCKMDSTFNIDNIGPDNFSRFSFYRIMFQQKLSDEVYVHCKILVCDESDPDCHLDCRYGDEVPAFRELLASQGPYTFPLALSGSPRLSPLWSWLLLLSILVVLK